MNSNKNLKDLSNAIRFLTIDAIEKSKSGHPGMPMGMADVATIVFTEFLNFDIQNPKWVNRDRFILSAGHGSMLLYSIAYLLGYPEISLEDIKNFRQLGSKTAGHPEFGEFSFTETTTGPLGQGIANSVGIALGERILNQKFPKIINHKTYCIVGDGCLMEGISYEAMSLAGHLNLSNLVVLWDNNNISIDGKLDITFSEDMNQRFKSCGWNSVEIDGHNFDEIRQALKQAQKSTKPTIISCKTTIAYGSPNKSGKSSSHGSPLGSDETQATRENLGWNYAEFEIPKNILKQWRGLGEARSNAKKKWHRNLEQITHQEREDFNVFHSFNIKNISQNIQTLKEEIFLGKSTEATRKSSGRILEFFNNKIPNLISGSADLTGSVNTKTSQHTPISKKDFSGRFIHYGIREHAMGAIMNGLALSGPIIPLSGTFLVFADYMRPAIRLSALMQKRVIYVLTHDSIGLGEDGPTHQPIEHLASLRAIPNLNVFRPADKMEVLQSWQIALESEKTPSAIILTRQNVGFFQKQANNKNLAKGGYIIDKDENPQVTLLATGSEVGLAFKVKEKLNQNGIKTKIVSIFSFEIFDQQDQQYKTSILGDNATIKIAIEAGIKMGWEKYIGQDGIFIGMSSFGASGKASDLFKHFGFCEDKITKRILEKLK